MNRKQLELSESSSDDSDSSGEDEQDFSRAGVSTSREKRNVSWCGVEDTNRPPSPHFPMIRRVVWPPPSTSQPSFRTAYVDPKGNPKLGNRMQLYCKNGDFLGVYPDGRVRGTKDEADPHTFLERKTGGLLPEHVKLQGMLTHLYVAMDKKGRLYAEADAECPRAVFIESFHGSYNNYLSRHYAHLGWYIGLKKSGKFKKGPKTKFGQKAIKFLPRRTRFE
ncbi:unnamed protein product [Ceutorhynchus assimilis]|uniref:Fibroblast growth factor n=1 Tax=Ceutorhynchus assimilis TaxID=467358 RepID=A0A9N9MQS9_9CUCU|nr:unnamed protein product [Ceutorhynchus assimilis]